MKFESSLPCSQLHTTFPQSDTHLPSPYHPNLIPWDPFNPHIPKLHRLIMGLNASVICREFKDSSLRLYELYEL